MCTELRNTNCKKSVALHSADSFLKKIEDKRVIQNCLNTTTNSFAPPSYAEYCFYGTLIVLLAGKIGCTFTTFILAKPLLRPSSMNYIELFDRGTNELILKPFIMFADAQKATNCYSITWKENFFMASTLERFRLLVNMKITWMWWEIAPKDGKALHLTHMLQQCRTSAWFCRTCFLRSSEKMETSTRCNFTNFSLKRACLWCLEKLKMNPYVRITKSCVGSCFNIPR